MKILKALLNVSKPEVSGGREYPPPQEGLASHVPVDKNVYGLLSQGKQSIFLFSSFIKQNTHIPLFPRNTQ